MTVVHQVSVCGPAQCTEDERARAYRVGRLLGEAGSVVICGGGTGVMAAVAAGVRSANGLVIGVRPNDSREGAGPDLSAVIVTNMGQARNAIIAWSADALIAIGGSWGTLSEVALASRRGAIPVIQLGGWRLVGEDGEPVPGIEYATTPEDAVRRALRGAARPG